MVRAVLFDLDDTLFDHRRCARAALAEVHCAHPRFRAHHFDAFEQMHASFLEELHDRVLAGELRLDDARQERFRRLFAALGVIPDAEDVARAAAAYRDGYQRVRQPIAGAARLLGLVRSRVPVGIVSNNLLAEQQEKLRHCELACHVDVLVVSEEARVSKPHTAIFELALERLGCRAADAVMIGDSWTADVAGARAAGIRAIWFNPSGQPAPEPLPDVAELRSLEPAEAALAMIFEAPDRPAIRSTDETPCA